MTWELTSRDSQNDAFYFWNQREVGKIGDRTLATNCVILASGKCSTSRFTSGLLTSTIDVMYGDLALLALDTGDKRGTSEVKIHSLQRIGNLPYEAPVVMGLGTDNYLGDVRFRDNYTAVTTGGKDRAISSLSSWLGASLDGLGTEGSGAIWNITPGEYEITWQVYASENDVDRDVFYWWDGFELREFVSRAIATNQRSATRWDSPWTTTKITVTGDTLGFIGLDTVDKSGTSELRISRLERVGTVQKMPEPGSVLGLFLIVVLWFQSRRQIVN